MAEYNRPEGEAMETASRPATALDLLEKRLRGWDTTYTEAEVINFLDDNRDALLAELAEVNAVRPEATRKSALWAKVTALRGLKANWDSYGAEAFPEATIQLAIQVALWLDNDEWGVVPCADGPSVWFTRNGEDEIIEVRTSYESLPQEQR